MHPSKTHAWSAVLLALFAASGTPGAQEAEPVRFGFEDDEPGSVPAGWFVPSSVEAGYAAEVVAQGAGEGERCVRVFLLEEGGEASFGNLMRSFDAAPFRGRRVRLSVSLRAGEGSVGQAWMRVDRPGGGMGFFDNMADRPVRDRTWGTYAIEGDVHGDAERISVGVMLAEGSEVFLDDVAFAVLGRSPEPSPPRALEDRGLVNLTALAELYGFVRYFHPSTEAAEADWVELACAGVEAVEDAPDAGALAAALAELFAPLAPAVRVQPTGAELQPPPGLDAPPPDGRVVVRRWHHEGLGAEGSTPFSVYRSYRSVKRLVGDELPDGALDPADVFRRDLAGGVSCCVPLALYETDGRTLPRPERPARGDAARDPAAEAPARVLRGDDRTTRLAAVIIAWNVFQHFYPYFDVVEADWRAELERALRAAAVDPDECAFLGTLQRLVRALEDGHGRVTHRCAWQSGALPFTWDWVQGELTVTSVPEELDVALRPGDVVREIDGRPVAELAAGVAATVSGATPQWIRYRTAAELARGKAGARASLAVDAFEGGRERVEVAFVPAGERASEPRPVELGELEPGIWYVDVSRVHDEQLARALEDLAEAPGIVWDFRGYPAFQPQALFPHLIEETSTSPQWHVPVFTRPNREGVTFKRRGEWTLEPREPRLTAEHVFLIDGRAISYAESCLGIVEHYELGELVGGPTAGTNGNVNPFKLPGGYRVVWTGMKVLKHDGSRHHGVGIRPTVPVARTRAGVAAGRDEILERGVEILRAAAAR